ncbi:MAG: hypothetical protein VX777_06165 [Chlamydiota bacterium]|nr:hypothetical protein [Chlamydiota bacterium]
MSIETHKNQFSGILSFGFSDNEEIENDGLFVELSDGRKSPKKCYDLLKSQIDEMCFRWSNRKADDNQFENRSIVALQGDSYGVDTLSWNRDEGSKKLVVFIHGLNGSPTIWNRYLLKLESESNQATTFAPYVKDKGYCKLKEAALPILEAVQNYISKYPDNSVTLVGYSNGASIAGYIERKINTKKVTLVSIAGAFNGTMLIDRINATPGLEKPLGISKDLHHEWMFDNDWHRKRVKKWQAGESAAEVKRIFFATANDICVYPFKTSFPYLPNSEYLLLSTGSHLTIIDEVFESVISCVADQQ